MNPSQEPAPPHRPDQPLADPTAPPAPDGPAADGRVSDGPASGGSIPGGRAGDGGQERNPWERPVADAPAEDYGFGSATESGFGSAAEGGFGAAHPGGPADPGAVTSGYEAAAPGYDEWEPAPARRAWRRTAVVGVASLLVVLVLGGPLGLIWHWLAPSVPVLDAGQNGIVVNDPSPEEYIAADGWYTLLGLGFGLVVAIVAWLVLRRDRGPIMLLGVVLGTLGAGYLIGPWIGGLIGKSGYEHWRETAAQGATYLAPPEVHSVGPKLVAAFAAAIALTLLAGWSNDPDLDEPGAKPGYGPNAAPAELHESETGA